MTTLFTAQPQRLPGPIAGSDNPSAHAGRIEGALVFAIVLGLPLLAIVAGAGALERMVYPASNLLLACWLYARRSPWYVGQTVLLFCAVSLIRRLVDLQAGWDPSNPVLLTPYLTSLLTVFSLVRYWALPRPRLIGPLLVVLGCIAYGVLIAALNGRLFGALVDALKWSVGPLVAVHVLAERERLPEIRRVVENVLIAAAPAMGLYGVAQFIDPPLWDVQWATYATQELGFTSIGQPEPFSLRVFSTMNSPGSLAAVLLAGLVFALKRPLPIALPAVACIAAGLALAQYRTMWGAAALAVLLLALTRPGALRLRNVAAAAGLLLVVSSAAIVPQMWEALTERFSSIGQLSDDESGQDRLRQYGAVATSSNNLVIGEGLALTGASRRLDGKAIVAIDSAVLEAWIAFGLFGALAFFGAILTLVVRLFTLPSEVASRIDFERVIVLATFIQLPMGSVHVGESGYLAWLCAGIGSAAYVLGTRDHRDQPPAGTGHFTRS